MAASIPATSSRGIPARITPPAACRGGGRAWAAPGPRRRAARDALDRSRPARKARPVPVPALRAHPDDQRPRQLDQVRGMPQAGVGTSPAARYRRRTHLDRHGAAAVPRLRAPGSLPRPARRQDHLRAVPGKHPGARRPAALVLRPLPADPHGGQEILRPGQGQQPRGRAGPGSAESPSGMIPGRGPARGLMGPWTRGALPGKANSAHADAGSPAAPTAPGPATKRAAAATRALRQTANTPEAWPSGREKRRAGSVTSWRRSPAPSSTARPQRRPAQPLGQPPPQPPSSAGHRPAGPAPPRPHHGAWPSQSWRPRRTAPAAARASIWGAPGHVPAVLARRGTAAHRPWLPGRPRWSTAGAAPSRA